MLVVPTPSISAASRVVSSSSSLLSDLVIPPVPISHRAADVTSPAGWKPDAAYATLSSVPHTEADMERQLDALYAEKELLFQELGTADAERIVAMVRSLERQLNELYAERERAFRPPR